MLDHVLDKRAVGDVLGGAHARFAERHGRAARYQADVAPFAALEDYADPRAWEDLAELIGPEGQAAVFGLTQWPDTWKAVWAADGLQMVGDNVEVRPEPEAVLLGADDVPEILDLVARTEPGPFLPRTVELGSYLGIRRDGKLIALAGERLRPPGWTEISAVCTRIPSTAAKAWPPAWSAPSPPWASRGARGNAVPARHEHEHERDPALCGARLRAAAHDHVHGAGPGVTRSGCVTYVRLVAFPGGTRTAE